MYALNIDKEKRILSACVVLPNCNYEGMTVVNTLPEGDITEYLFINGEYVHSPLLKEESAAQPTDLDYIKAQVAYTALITNTTLPSEEE